MSTNAVMNFYHNGGNIANIYHHWDGYPAGQGLELAKFLNKLEIGNGVGSRNMYQVANGFDCLVAQYIAKMKKEAGGVYMTTEQDSQEFNYNIAYYDRLKKYSIKIIRNESKIIFEGDEKEFLDYCQGEKDKIEEEIRWRKEQENKQT